MDQKQIEKEKMEALQALASTNMKVSEARNALVSLQEQETDYLVGREARAMERIDTVLKDSQEVLQTISKNYADSADLSREVSQTMDKIVLLLTTFRELKDKFAEKCDAWDGLIGEKEDALGETQKSIRLQSVLIENDKRMLHLEQKRIADERRRLDDDKAEFERTITRHKQGKL